MPRILTKIFTVTVLLTLTGCSHRQITIQPNTTSNLAAPLTMRYEQYKEITKPAGFVNSDPITIGELVGKKVILVDFLTYSCINCIRTFPYLNAWYEKYKDQGLEIVGIHTPEFAFEKKRENVGKAMKEYQITFPIVLDNDYGTWRAYKNNSWPRKYLIDIHGNIIYDHVGEGEYEETEARIQEALAERMRVLREDKNIANDMAKPASEAVNFAGIGSPEIYFGSNRNQYLGIGIPGQSGIFTFEQPAQIEPNTLYLVGEWNITPEYAEPKSKDASIFFRYRAARVNIVAGSDTLGRLTILRDGSPLGDALGQHVRPNGELTVNRHDLYEVIDDPSGSGEHTMEVKVNDANVRFYTLTFG